MKPFIFPYKEGSKGAKALSKSIGGVRIRHENSKFRYKPRKTVINWGASTLPDEVMKCRVINHPEIVARATNKLHFFEDMSGNCNTPEWTTNKEQAYEWIRDGYSVVCRSLLNASAGKGITIADNEEEIIEAPLYTRYVKKKDEYRIHVWNQEAPQWFDVQKKRRKLEEDDPNWRVRNAANGFIYAREEIKAPDSVIDEAINCFSCLGLDFGAVDVIFNAHEDKAYVLEINTAPGLEGTTLDNYSRMIRNFF